MTWHAGREMLVLVGRIAQDVVTLNQRMAGMQTELAHLERNRRTLSWPDRARRYQLEDEIARAGVELRAVVAELEGLGVALLDQSSGLVGFPTLVNDRKAYFSWQPGEESLLYWNYVDDLTRNLVPEEWTEVVRERPTPTSRRSRPRKK
jgi:hypothetical protein